jgi:hypothetical protein
LHGKGPRFRNASRPEGVEAGSQPTIMVGALLRTALQLLEGEAPPDRAAVSARLREFGRPGLDDLDAIEDGPARPDETAHDTLRGDGHDRGEAARSEWIEARNENRCLRVVDESMAPVIAKGASVAFAREAENAAALDGKIVVAWIDHVPLIRWYQNCGRYALLRAQDPDASPQQSLIDLEDETAKPRFRRVLWIETPH